MKKLWIGIFGLLLFSSLFSPARADEDKKFRIWKELVAGNGGTVPNQASLGTAVEYSFFQDDYNHDVTFSAEFFSDATTYGGSKLVFPVLANYRWFVGPQSFNGIFFTAGLGEMIPFGSDHGGGVFAWQGGIGYIASKRIALELRYLGRRAQNVNNLGTNFRLTNTFLAGMLDFSF